MAQPFGMGHRKTPEIGVLSGCPESHSTEDLPGSTLQSSHEDGWMAERGGKHRVGGAATFVPCCSACSHLREQLGSRHITEHPDLAR